MFSIFYRPTQNTQPSNDSICCVDDIGVSGISLIDCSPRVISENLVFPVATALDLILI